MLLVANVGNTTIRLGGFEDRDEPAFIQSASVANLEHLHPPSSPVEALVLGSVNPVAAAFVRSWAEETLECPVLELRVELPVPLRFACDDPSRIGADRIANAIALHKRTGRGGVAVDFGTAINLAVVSPDGEFVGGAIAPGLAMAARALHRETALLPAVDVSGTAPGLSCQTETAVATGLLWGLPGMVDRLIERLTERWPHAPVLATGGDAELLVPHCRRVSAIVPHLTLEGLRQAYLQRPR
jgi:type III pantothenate kinase